MRYGLFLCLLFLLMPLMLVVHETNSQASTAYMTSQPYSINKKSDIHKRESMPAFARQRQINEDYADDGWSLIWHDEFETKELDTQKWNVEHWAAEKNNELQFYTPKNIEVNNDYLTLISKLEKHQGRNYTSGAIHTKDKFSFQYGKAEIRAKLPKGQGLLPAFWMMPNIDHTWLPEIDVLEMLGHDPNTIYMVQHWLDDNEKLTSESTSFTGDNYSEDFHTFSVEWSPTGIIWLIDGIERFQTNTFTPSDPMYVYLNTAVGGDWPGDPDQTTAFPQHFIVDYVRVFQKIGG